jgi:hypothetical protein
MSKGWKGNPGRRRSRKSRNSAAENADREKFQFHFVPLEISPISISAMYKHVKKSLRRGLDVSDDSDDSVSLASADESGSSQSATERDIDLGGSYSDLGSDSPGTDEDDEDDSEDPGLSDDDEEEEEEEEFDSPDDLPSVKEAIDNPICSVEGSSSLRQCVLCPGKVLKTEQMVEVHEQSAVRRRPHPRTTLLCLITRSPTGSQTSA